MAQGKKKVKKVKFWRKALFFAAGTILEKSIDKVKDVKLKVSLKAYFIEPIKLFKEVLTDKDPNDAEQVGEVWEQVKGLTKLGTIEVLKEAIDQKVKDDFIKESIVLLLNEYQNSLAIEENEV